MVLLLLFSDISQDEWDRDSLLKLKVKLEKLIRPDLNHSIKEKLFEIFLEAPEELEADNKPKTKNDIVNGKVKNFIFDALDIKTTKIISQVSKDGKTIKTSIFDRGNQIYTISEYNEFHLLKNIIITLYFLNQSAKTIFTKKMGVQGISYGNIFVYKNGFRIYPFGERGDDSLGIDSRSLQGYNRFLALRNLMGQIDIQGHNKELREATSRDAGLIKTKTYYQLADITPYKQSMLLNTLKRLEKYVVDITNWGVNEDEFDVKNDDKARDKLIASIASISGNKNFINISYDKDIFNKLNKLNTTKDDASKLIQNLKNISNNTKNTDLDKTIIQLEKNIKILAKDYHNTSKILSQSSHDNIELSSKLDSQIKENLFVKSSISIDNKELHSIQHHIHRSAAQNIPIYLKKLSTRIHEEAPKEELFNLIGKISLENKKIITLSQFVAKANFNTMTSYINNDIVEFVSEYAQNVYLEYQHLITNNQKINISIKNQDNLIKKIKFRPIEVVIIFDNLFNNAFKANASKINLIWKKYQNNKVVLIVKDNGHGIKKEFIDKVFDFRFSTTNGSGLGLYHVKKIIEDMEWSINVENNPVKGVAFTLRFEYDY